MLLLFLILKISRKNKIEKNKNQQKIALGILSVKEPLVDDLTLEKGAFGGDVNGLESGRSTAVSTIS